MASEEFKPTRDLFVITEKQSSNLATPVFSVGENEEAVAIFMTRRGAEKYIAAADWSDTDVAAELSPRAIVKWLLTARENGPTVVVINPNREEHEAGQPLQAIRIDELISLLGATAVDHIISQPASRSDVVFVSYTTYRCEECNRLDRKSSGGAVPTCHDQPMVTERKDLQATPEEVLD
jgi:hypothetical protein